MPGALGRQVGVAGVLVALTLVAALAPPASAQTTQPDCSTVAGNLVGDCGFESPALGTTANRIFSASTGFPVSTGPWFAGSGGAEIDNNAANGEWNPNSGNQSADVNPGGPNAPLFQDIPTQAGHVYSVTFALAGNPIPGGFLQPCADSPALK